MDTNESSKRVTILEWPPCRLCFVGINQSPNLCRHTSAAALALCMAAMKNATLRPTDENYN